jgi:outer membrane lipoprotein carrier protein
MSLGGAGFGRRRLVRASLVVAGFVLAGGVPLQAQTRSESARAQLHEFIQGTRSARAEFTQKTLKADGGTSDRLSGVLAFSRPGKFRWEVRKPYPQLMLGDGEKLYFHDPDLNQVTVRRLSEAVGSSPAAVLFGSNDLERSFDLRDQGESGGLQWLEARPRAKEAGFESLRLGFRGGLPELMEVKDAFGRTTVFQFSGFERNPALDPALFRFLMPKGADLISQ